MFYTSYHFKDTHIHISNTISKKSPYTNLQNDEGFINSQYVRLKARKLLPADKKIIFLNNFFNQILKY